MSFSAITASVPLRVLVVDDEPIIARLVTVRVRRLGFEAETVHSGVEALERLQQEEKPDILIMDIAMPGLSGLEVLEQIRAGGSGVGVIMMTAFGSEEVAMEALRLGANEYLRKPFNSLEFNVVIERLAHRIQLERDNRALRAQQDTMRWHASELHTATLIQAALLPSAPPALPGYELGSHCLPARRGGSDFFFWVAPDQERLLFVLADMHGRTLSGALHMAALHSLVQEVGRRVKGGRFPQAMLEAVQGWNLDDEALPSLFLGELALDSHRLRFIDAGLGLAALCQGNGTSRVLAPTGPRLGMQPPTHYSLGEITLEPGALLLLCTDGVRILQARGPDALALLQQVPVGATAAEALLALLAPLPEEGGSPPDDLSLLLLRRLV